MAVRSFETDWGGKKLVIETGRYAGQANGACTVRYGDTVVLATATMSKKPRVGIDFFPLSVEYEEKLYAAGKIKSSRFIKREGRPSDGAVMTARMIDRGLRPLFPYGMRHEVQIVLNCLSVDLENGADVPGLIAAATVLAMSDIPWNGPIASIRVGRVGGEWVINPTFEARANGDLDVIVTGTPEKVLMIEANAKEVPEQDMYDAVMFGQKHLREVLDLINQIVQEIGRAKQDPETLKGRDEDETDEDRSRRAGLQQQAKEFLEGKLEEKLFAAPKANKVERRDAVRELKKELRAHLETLEEDEDKREQALEIFDETVDKYVAKQILDNDRRVDGRALNEVRNLSAEVALLPRTHGSGLFERGETQILSVVTLGSPGDVQLLDGMEQQNFKKRYMHHYNFPPFSCGETGRVGGFNRREIGHGGLAERALEAVLPPKEEFPYTIRVVSEVYSSNGSSSQGSICGSTLALMDAGVPIKRPVAGIAMGMASDDQGRWKVLADIQDLEDGKGGMDFKIGGTTEGICTIQLDTKTDGLTPEMIDLALKQGREARLQILGVMAQTIAEPRKEMSPYAPRIETFMIPVDRIRDVIGPGGKIINEIIDATGVQIDIEQDGTVNVCSNNGPQLERAVQWIRDLTREVEVGEVFKEAKVTRILDFGAFAEVLPNQEGMIHISELAPWRVEKVTDMLNIGDTVPVKVIQIDDLGRINLSMKQAKQELGIDQTPPEGAQMRRERPQGDRRGRGGPRGNDRRGGRRDRGPRPPRG